MKFFTFLFLSMLLLAGCTSTQKKTAQNTHPFQAVFHTTQGDFTVTFHPEWAPIGAAHARKLIESGFYSDIAIFRVVEDYVVQFGIHDNSWLNEKWMAQKLKDEPVLHPNKQWTMAYARDGADTRDTQLFINLKDNSQKLDTINYMGCRGFPVIGEVTAGTETISKFFKAYDNKPAMEQDDIYAGGNAYLKRNYPELDYILSAAIVE